MGKSLVIAEKPSVAKEIAKNLKCRQNSDGYISGDKYIVTWALGHLVTLADPEIYDDKYKTWNLESLPMVPKNMKLTVIKETQKQFKTVRNLLKRTDVTEIIIATDAGREGELVARWILIKADCKKPLKRLWISSQTDKAIREGFLNLKLAKDYYNLFLSAEARAKADWLVGLNVTRALTCKYNVQLSAGRVQTPTLALIVQREQDIKNFRPQDYYIIKAEFNNFNAIYNNKNNQSRIFDKDTAEKILNDTKNKPAVISNVKKQYKHVPPPAAYDLTELQRDANKKYGYTAKQTLSFMQALYERHKLLTYPRTDSRYITDDVANTISERLKSISIGKYKEFAVNLLKNKAYTTRYIVNNNKVTDHHAIIPTEEPVFLSKLSNEEKNIYDLVVLRFLAVLSAPFEYEETKLYINIGKELFTTKGKVIKSPGFKAIYNNYYNENESDSDDDIKEQNLPMLNNGDKLQVKKCYLEQNKTKPPLRYTEATLLTAMENPTNQVESKESDSFSL